MKRTLLLAILLASLLAVFFIPTLTVHAAATQVDQQPAPVAQPVAQQSPAVQIVIGLVVALFGCLALAPAAFGERRP